MVWFKVQIWIWTLKLPYPFLFQNLSNFKVMNVVCFCLFGLLQDLASVYNFSLILLVAVITLNNGSTSVFSNWSNLTCHFICWIITGSEKLSFHRYCSSDDMFDSPTRLFFFFLQKFWIFMNVQDSTVWTCVFLFSSIRCEESRFSFCIVCGLSIFALLPLLVFVCTQFGCAARLCLACSS